METTTVTTMINLVSKDINYIINSLSILSKNRLLGNKRF